MSFRVGDGVRAIREDDSCFGRVGEVTHVGRYDDRYDSQPVYDVTFGDQPGDKWRFLGDESLELAEFTTHDSGERVDYPSGMRRDIDKGKLRFDLIPTFMLRRVAGLYTRGAEKYGDDNWTLANSEEEMQRFRASAFRHFVQWLDGERDEDHGAAVFFNITAAEYVRDKLTASPAPERSVGVVDNGTQIDQNVNSNTAQSDIGDY